MDNSSDRNKIKLSFITMGYYEIKQSHGNWYNQEKDLREKWITELGQIRIYDS